MNSGKVDNQLNLALDVGNDVRQQTIDLDVGFNSEYKTWELIIRYAGDINSIIEDLQLQVVNLVGQFAIIIISEDKIDELTEHSQIIYVEKPKRLTYELNDSRAVSCIPPVQTEAVNLTGEGVLVAIIDSGVDYIHPDFRNLDGTTRIIELWDQTIQGNPPPGYIQGTVYSKEQINQALQATNRFEALKIVPSTDISGHGTHVAGIACGGGRARETRYRGVAYQSDILVVKLGSSVSESFPSTTQLMQAINYCVQTAIRLQKPIAINISFGNNYGSHTGQSVLENYIDNIANIWKTCIVIGTGNEGASRTHTSGILVSGVDKIVELPVSESEYTFNLQIWKNYYDEFSIQITEPGGRTSGPIAQVLGKQQFVIGGTEIYLFFGEPQPANGLQEIYMEFIPAKQFVTPGIWEIKLSPERIVVGNYDMWLPSGGVLNQNTGFLRPTEVTTLTIPSTAFSAISVGAYDGTTDSYAYFSGRGFTRNLMVKPDLVAPGVNIMSAAPNGGYTVRSGTSMATPFVTGSAALLMQWGIVRGNDPYLYGEKAKSYLINGARHLPIERLYPNPTLGYGALCLKNSIPNI